MATEKIAMGINLRQNKNVKMTASYGKYYPEVDQQKTLSLRGFAQHMVDHGSFFSRSVVEGVLNQICECLPEILAQGVPVKLGSLGTFYPTAQVKKNAAVPDIASMEGLNPNDIVCGIRIRFQPDASKLDNLSSVAFKDTCSLELRNIVDTKEVTIDGKKQKLQTLKPIATAVAEWKAQNGDNTSQGSNTGSNTGGDTGGNTGGGDDNPDGIE
jgi:predicted histone-like DNA-binding protein